MEILIIIAVVMGAFYFGFTKGKEEGENEKGKLRKGKVMNAFSMGSHDSSNIFNRVYGVNGAYYSDIDSVITAPLVVIQSYDLARFVAIEKIASYRLTGEYLNDDEIEKSRIEISNRYLRENGMSEETITYYEGLNREES